MPDGLNPARLFKDAQNNPVLYEAYLRFSEAWAASGPQKQRRGFNFSLMVFAAGWMAHEDFRPAKDKGDNDNG